MARARQVHRGLYVFRSPLEADYAQLFDSIGVPWLFELGPCCWSFYLPRSGQYFLVRDVHDLVADACTVSALDHACSQRQDGGPGDLHVIVGLPGGQLLAYRAGWISSVGLFACLACEGWWFLDSSLGWTCRCCGAADGNGHVDQRFEGSITPWPCWRFADSGHVA